MALENVMRVDNGNIVTGGGTGGSSVEIDWEDWCKLTPEEQETGDWTIINCPWADGNVSVDLMTKLWENPNPTTAFATQTIQMDLSEYDLILVTVCGDSGTSAVISKGKTSQLIYLSASATAPAYGVIGEWRSVTFNNNGVIFSNNYQMYTGGTLANVNSFNIPYQIYGIKLTATVKINAIAMDVSTSADKCMLSENESVEDRLDANTISSENVVSLTYNTEYTTLSDGYFRISCGSGLDTWATGYVNNISVIRCTSVPTQTANGMVSVYVHKGSKIKFDGKNSTDASGKFYPLT